MKQVHPQRLSDLLRCRVVTGNGRRLGRVHDVRARDDGRKLVVTEIVFGMPGILERLGFKEATRCCAPWNAVVEMRAGHIVVDAARVSWDRGPDTGTTTG